MKIETSCASCGSAFLIDEVDGRGAPCPVCGKPLLAGPQDGAGGGAARAASPSVVPAGNAPEPPAQNFSSATSVGEEVVCPRCSLHFVPRTGGGQPEDSSRRTVLVVEDMEYFIEIARDALEPRYQVKTAKTVEEARTLLGVGDIALMLLDLTLAGGEEASQLLDELPFKPCPILIYTAEDESVMYGETWEQLQARGADDVVIKGMNVGESIVRKVDSLLGEPEDGQSSGA